MNATATVSPGALAAAFKSVRVTGSVLVPASLISDAAGNVISNNAGGLVSVAGSSIISNNVGGYRLLKVEQRPASRVKVELTDADGTPYRRIPPVFTDERGRFSFDQVPEGLTYRVTATVVHAGREIKLTALTTGGRDVNVDVASTLVTAQLISGRSGDLTKIPEEQFIKAVAAVAAVLDEKTVKAVVETKNDRELVVELERVVKLAPQAAVVLEQVVTVLTKLLEVPATPPPVLNTTPPPAAGPGEAPAPVASAGDAPLINAPAQASAAPGVDAPTPAATTGVEIEPGTAPASGTDNGQTVVEVPQSELDDALGTVSPSPSPTPTATPSGSGVTVDGGLGITNGQLINPSAIPGISF